MAPPAKHKLGLVWQETRPTTATITDAARRRAVNDSLYDAFRRSMETFPKIEPEPPTPRIKKWARRIQLALEDTRDLLIGLIAIGSIVAVFALLIGLLLWVVIAENAQMESFTHDCVEQGGHLYSPDIVLCVSDDGRIVEALAE